MKLHGHIPHEERFSVYKKFKEFKKGILISTDVGSRGLDFEGVELIVLVDPPESLIHYSNRVGRTARLTRNGSSLLLLHPSENKFLDILRSKFEIKEFDSEKLFEEFEAYIPMYYPIGESDIYLNHCIKKVTKVFISELLSIMMFII